ncbi:EAL domain-containing protein [Ralstonia insidiosa]|jgi:EAL domain-containing protein (putative c-di-GMP-specific phosphodiesterase class I)|uniref:EAL domain-containing protein n=1 Tax=Ralstonia TaxID=48736 RepID=UPI000664A975|nr:EAL domain-containing protein [Ralstonia insidiosa]KMW48394.1 diguanylate phosphodiesterase [Ralstonia sp. MD27]MBX3770852.1 EAL domain-containing protein [Ralstonia pickettii]NOZ15120.1 EAL domain-containing protein [Betaproteobacteria bacterium]MBA9855010.1 EAL domain-containing protein [Ralstonia insidiosa]MBA9872127.1 EAL domain-containing protein [Ralstonia insidiosa]
MSLMHTTALAQFLGTLPSAPTPDRQLWRDASGRVQGQFFHSSLTSLFEPVWQLAADGTLALAGHEALMRTWTRDGDLGLNPWKLFSLASDDSTLVELDRLCRLVHTLNYFARTDARRLVVNVHGRLLAAVAADHGKAFHRAVVALGLSPEQFVIQVPSTANDDLGLLLFVVDNYRRNGFAVAVQASDPAEAGALLVHAKPAYLKLDARRDWVTRHVVSLAESARELGITLTLRRCERPSDLELARAAGITHVQGSVLPGAEPEPEPVAAPEPLVLASSTRAPMAQAPLVQQQCAGFSLIE